MAPIILHRPSVIIGMIYSIYRKENTDFFDFQSNRIFKSKGIFRYMYIYIFREIIILN